MKTLSLSLMIFCCIAAAPLQATVVMEVEPNDVLAEATPFSPLDTLMGSIGGGDGSDYARSFVVGEGAFTVHAASAAGSTGTAYLDVYNKNGGYLGGAGLLTSGGVKTFTLDCYASDTLHIRVHGSGSHNYKIWLSYAPEAWPDDAEPNNVLTEALSLSRGDTAVGHMGYGSASVSTDNNDYYRGAISVEGSFSVSAYMEGMSAYLYVYNKNGGYLGGTSLISDGQEKTFTLDCYAADTIYMRLQRHSNCGTYRITYNQTKESWPDDNEPNNVLAEALSLGRGDTAVGHMGYGSASVSTDNNDYYRGAISVEGSFSVSAYMEGMSAYLYVYNKNGGYLGGTSLISDGQEKTFTLDCYAADTIYMRLQRHSNCGTYRITYNQTKESWPDDNEPNNVLAEALSLGRGDTAVGHMGYGSASVSADNNDYYRGAISVEGSFSVSAYMEGMSAYLYVYNKNGTYLGGTSLISSGQEKTFTLNCYAADTIYMRLQRHSNCGSYRITYNQTKESWPDDAEPNNSLAEARSLGRGDTAMGHMGYGSASVAADVWDWYRGAISVEGSFTITGYMDGMSAYLDVFNKNGTYLGGTNVIGDGQEKSFTVDCYAADTIYLRLQRHSGCGSYRITYNQTKESWPDDAEPNNSLAEAQSLGRGDTAMGHMGYGSASVAADVWDWYRGAISVEGSFTITGYMDGMSAYLDVFNKNGTYLGGTNVIGDGQEKSFTVDCYAADTIYLRLQRHSGCGSYRITYQQTPLGASPDAEPNNSIATATPITVNSAVNGTLGYGSASVVADNSDYYALTVTDSTTLDLKAPLSNTLNARWYLYTASGTYITGGFTASDTARLEYLLSPADYILRLERVSGCGAYSFSPVQNTCPTPSGLGIGPLASVAAMLQWVPEAEAESYVVETRPLGSGGWASSVTTKNKFPFFWLTRCTDYEFRVQNVCAESSSFFSAPHAFQTRCAPVCPRPKEDTLLAVTDSSATIAWRASRLDISYEVFYRIAGTIDLDTVVTTDTFALLGELLPDTTYEYAIRALCYDNGVSPFTRPDTVHTGGGMVLRTLPSTMVLDAFPNPAVGYIDVQLGTALDAEATILMSDLAGRTRLMHALPAGENHTRLDLRELPSGSYLLQLRNSQGQVWRKTIQIMR